MAQEHFAGQALAKVVKADSALTAADLTLLSGVTATAAEINKLASSGAVVASGTQAANISAVPTAGSADAAANATAINSIIAALEAFGITATA